VRWSATMTSPMVASGVSMRRRSAMSRASSIWLSQ